MREEIPYGLKVSADCRYLEEDPAEMNTLLALLEGVVADQRMSAIAEDLNRRGFRTRNGDEWNQVSVYHLLPRLIEVSPKLFTREEWAGRREQALRLLPSAASESARRL